MKCMINVANSVVKRASQGYPEFGLPVFDPLKIDAMNIEQGGNSPVNLKIHLRNFELIGLSNVKFVSIQGFGREFDNTKMELRFTIPTWQILGERKNSK